MPSLWSSFAAVSEEPCSTALRSIREVGRSVIVFTLLPLAALQTKPGNHDRREQERIGDEPEPLPARRAIERRRLVKRWRHCLQAGQQRDRDEGNAAPDIGKD